MGTRERRELSGDEIGAMAHAIKENDPEQRIAAERIVRALKRNAGEEAGEEKKYKQRVIGREITYGSERYDKDKVRRIRLVIDNFGYTRLQIGLRYEDTPRKFTVERQLTLTEEEFPLALQLMNSLANKPRPKI